MTAPTNDTGETGEIVPPGKPHCEPPELLVFARDHLDVATNEFYIALQRFEMWRQLAYNQELIDRLGSSFATGGYIAVRGAVFEALLITLTRMFDQGARGRNPLSLRLICNNLCRPEVRSFLITAQASDELSFPERLGWVAHLTEVDRTRFEINAQAAADRMRTRANGEFDALVRLQRALARPRIANALERLNRLRDTEIAHRELEPSASVVQRPFYRDLTTIFAVAAVLVRRMNKLGRNLDISYGMFAENARRRAKAFAYGLRAETPEERTRLRSPKLSPPCLTDR